ncbi:unnamed protein product [Laminaria digitata]
MVRALLLCLLTGISAFAVHAGEADVTDVQVHQASDGSWRFDVTVRHADEGWDHYADRWEVVDAEGNVYGTRVLAHPHVDEQPFTRSLSGIEFPDDLEEVIVRARDSVHGYGGAEVVIPLIGRF